MAGLRDSTDAVIGYLTFDLVSGETSPPTVIRVTAAANLTLLSESDSHVQLKARHHGTADPFVDLAGGIDLGAFSPGPVDFDLIAVAGSITGLVRVALFIGVTSAGGAAWAA